MPVGVRLRRRLVAGLGASVALIRRMTIWQWGIVIVVVLYTWYFTLVSLRIHHGLGTPTFDYALYDQGVWLVSRFKAPFVTLMGRNLLGDHTSFILIFLVPIYWVFPSAGALFFSQAFAVAISSVPVFLYARRRLGNEAMALVLSIGYLIHPALQWSNLEDFHPDVFLAPLLMFAIYAALAERWRMYVVFVVLSLLVKEDVSLVIVPLGIWVALRRDRWIGLATIAGSIAYAFFAVAVVMRTFVGSATPNLWRIPFGGIRGFIAESISRPGNVLDYLRADGRPWYVWQMITPFAWMVARLPDVALISGLVLATNVVSNFGYQHQIFFHYSVVALPALALGTVHALGALRGRGRMFAVTGVVVMSLWTAFLWGPLPFARNKVGYWAPDHPVAEAAREIIEEVPDDAVVSAHYLITSHMARREQIYMFPNPFNRVMYGTDVSLEGTRLPQANEVEYVVLQTDRESDVAAQWDQISHEFERVRANSSWELYQRIDSENP